MLTAPGTCDTIKGYSTLTETMTKAEEAYTRQHAEAMHLLSQLQRRLENAPAPDGDVAINWGHVGSLAHVNETLQELVAFLNTGN
jgi:hypothetical protein